MCIAGLVLFLFQLLHNTTQIETEPLRTPAWYLLVRLLPPFITGDESKSYLSYKRALQLSSRFEIIFLFGVFLTWGKESENRLSWYKDALVDTMWSGAVLSLHWQLLKQLYLTSSGPSMDLSYLLLKRWHEKKTIWKPDPHVVEFLYGWLIVCSSLSSAFQHEGKAHTGPHSPYRIYHMVDRSSLASWRIGMSSRWCNELQTKYRWKAKTCLRPVERPV